MGDFKLQLEPADKIVFSGKKLGEEPAPASIKITNTLKERIAYKIECLSNERFRNRPPVGPLKPDDNVAVSVKTLLDSGKHYFAVYYINATDEKKAPRATWADHKGEPEGTERLYVDFKKVLLQQFGCFAGNGEKKKEKKEEKKDEEKKDEKKDDDKKDDKKDEKKDDEKKRLEER
ncbi:hypothetical protein KIN20_034576 [Parelaphostrongylus tenuis]|uniref:Major sperm protein n=1 Tax=Parelaphostrongylus tenuis TaxID=148309 RepID=A0AAD5R9X0_PARTN|nr:hypothetical protein KIN20_034576 [Parelaphostrongylus tenuis]